MEHLRATLARQISADVHAAGHFPVELVEKIVSAGLDATISTLGSRGLAAAESVGPYIRKVVSEKALDYLSGLIDALKGTPPDA